MSLRIEGERDGFVLSGISNMTEIGRDPLDLVSQTCGDYHQYPDGFMLFLGTMFSPTQDRKAPGEGFTHELGDRVVISTPSLGTLVNTVQLSTSSCARSPRCWRTAMLFARWTTPQCPAHRRRATHT